MLTEQEIRTKVQNLKQFYMDLINYGCVNGLLILIWLVFDRDWNFWPLYVMVVWGFVLLAKAYWGGLLPVFFYHLSFLDADWEDKKIKDLMGALQPETLPVKIPLKSKP